MSGPFGSAQWMASTGSSKFYTKTIDNSLRFDGSTSYLSRTGVVGNNQKWTWSAWVKKCNPKLSDFQWLFCASTGSTNRTDIFFSYNATYGYDTITFYGNNGAIYYYKTTAMFRDVAGWYHIVVSVDGSLADGSKTKIYVNGIQQATSYSGTFTTTPINTTASHYLGSYWNNPPADAFDGYITETYLIDGYALDHTSFGEFKNGVWIAKTYAGSYGNNGHYLDFADGTSATTLGYDVSGNSNHFTPTGIATTDQMLDSPTNNFCTINPLKIGSVTLSEGNLQHQHSGSTSWRGVTPTMHVSSGKWYWEVAFSNLYTPPASTTQALVGIVSENETQTNVTAATYFTGMTAEAYGYYNYGGSIWNNNSGTAYGSTWGNATIGIALDLDSSPKTLEFFLNGVSQGVLQDGTNINLGDKAWGPGASTYYSSVASYNFGQFDFTYTPPSGFLALSSVNLPTPTFDPAQGASPLDAFNSVLYDGNGTDAHAITGVGFSPDFTWIKARGPVTRYHRLTDTVRGATRSLTTNGGFAETVDSTHLQSFDADGFTLGTQASFNASGETYVAWNWKLGGSSNTFNIDGTGYSTASAAGLDGGTQNPTGATVNTEAGIGIYTYTGDGTTTHTVAHGLGVTPKVVIIKNRSTVANWFLYTDAVDGSMDFGVPNLTDAFGATTRYFTSSVFEHSNSTTQGANGDDYVAWVFAEKEGFSKFGSYEGNASADGTFVYLGFKPAWVMIKNASTASTNWAMFDNKRDGYNVDNDYFLTNTNDIENTTDVLDLVSNGFKLRNSSTSNGAYTYFYMAFAEQPFKYSNAR